MGQLRRHILKEQQQRETMSQITAVLRVHPEIAFAFLHGSFIDGPFFHDIDLGIFVRGIDCADFWDYEAALAQEIEEALNSPYVVEPKVINRAPLSFCYHVTRGRLLFTRDENSVVAFMVHVARTYLDMAPMRHRYIMEAMK